MLVTDSLNLSLGASFDHTNFCIGGNIEGEGGLLCGSLVSLAPTASLSLPSCAKHPSRFDHPALSPSYPHLSSRRACPCCRMGNVSQGSIAFAPRISLLRLRRCFLERSRGIGGGDVGTAGPHHS
ncbi:hypothetical protein KSP40_PGU012688 [Platanthera guangdongensis]|uniref:Uncharacterized protein n=1 Tax=Platanthera guangdongensis TaxID=2320717 RepID=A0ABR2M5J5_9ASPA